MVRKFKNRESGFTLAEVLITLGIIGIVAAMTIPSLIEDYQKTQWVAGLKKSYAEITEALKLMANDHGCPGDLRCTGVFMGSGNFVDDNKVIGNELKKYLKIAKDCGTGYNSADDSTKCLSDTYSSRIDGKGNNFNGTGARHDTNSDSASSYKFITADGFAVAITNQSSAGMNCDSQWDTPETSSLVSSQVCAFVTIDVNNFKGPNNYGRDIFWFYITNGKGPMLYPNGGSIPNNGADSWADTDGTPKYCDSDAPWPGIFGDKCAGRIIEQGWQMLY